MKFILFVEGDTEHKALPPFFKRWLDPQLDAPVGIQSVKFNGWSDLRKEVKTKAHLYLNSSQSSEILAVISLMDLYGPDFYPTDKQTADERYDWAKETVESEVNHPKFRQFFAVHEVEAWLLSQPDIFPHQVQKDLNKKVSQPEHVNFNQPPSELLNSLYEKHLKRNYKKVVNGEELFKKLTPQEAYNKCPRLKEMLNEMLDLSS